jgi:hypothetical protein
MKKIFLSFFLLINALEPKTIKVENFDDGTVEGIRDYLQKHPGPLTVKIEGEQNMLQKALGLGEWAMGTSDSVGTSTGGLLSVKSLAQWAFGGTVVSYGAGIYVIYRAYRLIKQLGSWTHSLGDHEDDEVILYVRQGNNKELQNKYMSEIKKEKEILLRYLRLHKSLQNLHIRWLFPQNKAYDRCILEREKRLDVLERKVREQF